MPLQITFLLEKTEALEILKKRAGHENIKELIDSALAVYGWAISSLEEGKIIACLNERDSEYHELLIPTFDKLKEQIPWGTWVEES